MTATLIEKIKGSIFKAGRGLAGKNGEDKPQSISRLELEEDPQRLRSILDGMGTGTARIIIDRESSRRILEEFKLKKIENKGRYYVARVVRPDGSLIDELLVDKQNGRVQFIKRS